MKLKHPVSKAFFNPDDAFYVAEGVITKGVEPVSTKILNLTGHHYKLSTVHKKDNLFRNVMWLEHKAHATHSTGQRIHRFDEKFKKTAFLDTPYEKLKRKLKGI